MIRSTVRKVIPVVVVMLGSALYAQRGGPAPPPGRNDAKAGDTNQAWNQAEIVFIGELTEARTGPATRSLPPIFMNRLSFKVEKVLRGSLAGNTLSCGHSYRGNENFPYEPGREYIVALSSAWQTVSVRDLRLADAAAIKQVEMACALPLGWKIVDGKAVSPWAALGKDAWSAQLPADAEKAGFVCEKTGRPALLAGPAVTWTVEAVAPKKSIQWTNPDGDGEYKVTLTNPADRPATVPALLTQDGKILWRQCVVIICQERVYTCPGGAGVAGKVAPLVLKPKESVSTVINALALQGPDWPRGGYRIEFTFCLGDKAKTVSFYYMSRHHDPLREALHKPGAGGTD
jgi:hypothetical protein